MRKDERIISEETLANGQVLVTRVYYSKGSGRGRGRGYYAEAKPVTRAPDGTESFMCFSWETALVAEAARFNAKELASLVVEPAVLATLREKVLAKVARGETGV